MANDDNNSVGAKEIVAGVVGGGVLAGGALTAKEYYNLRGKDAVTGYQKTGGELKMQLDATIAQAEHDFTHGRDKADAVAAKDEHIGTPARAAHTAVKTPSIIKHLPEENQKAFKNAMKNAETIMDPAEKNAAQHAAKETAKAALRADQKALEAYNAAKEVHETAKAKFIADETAHITPKLNTTNNLLKGAEEFGMEGKGFFGRSKVAFSNMAGRKPLVTAGVIIGGTTLAMFGANKMFSGGHADQINGERAGAPAGRGA